MAAAASVAAPLAWYSGIAAHSSASARGRVLPADERPQPRHAPADRGRIEGGLARHADRRVRRAQQLEALHGQLLPLLLARPQANEMDRHVGQPGVHGQAPQPVRQIEDAHRLAHVEPEHLAHPALPIRLQHEGHRLSRGHEVAGRERIRHLHRLAAPDPIDHHFDDAAAARQHVAEAHDHRARVRPAAGEDGELGQALARAHDAAGIGRLVGRDQQEAGAVLRRQPRDHERCRTHWRAPRTARRAPSSPRVCTPPRGTPPSAASARTAPASAAPG